MQNRRIPLAICVVLAAALGLLTACSSWGFFSPCKAPDDLSPESLLGTWHLAYPSDHWVSDPIEGSLVVTGMTPYLVAPDAPPMALTGCEWLVGLEGRLLGPEQAWERCPLLRGPSYQMEGQEMLTLYEDGTYQQTFVSGAFAYNSPLNRWQFIGDSPDGPKLRMENMKYFAEGVSQANSSVRIVLHPQVVDSLRAQRERESQSGSEMTNLPLVIAYPDDGFIYLYPRLCEGELSLAQMVFRPSDADNQIVANPVFTRRR